MSLQRLGVGCVVVLLVWQAAVGAARAQTPARLHGAIDDAQVMRVEHSTHPLAQPSNEVGRVESDKKLDRVILVLSPSDSQKEELNKLLDDLHNPKSPNYHHWLSAAEFGARFGVADADVQRVREWLERSGFQVQATGPSKRRMEFSGTAAQVEVAFGTELHYYLVGGEKYLANSTDIGIPAQLANVSPGVASLNNFRRIAPRHIFGGLAGRNADGQKVRMLRPSLTAAGASNTYYTAPGDFSKIYNTSSLLSAGVDGTGVAIAVAAHSNIELTDVQMFRQIFGLKQNDPNIVLSGPDPGIANQTDAEEATLDAEWAGAIAPGATINLVVAGTTATTNGVDLAAAYAIENEVAPILTYTYGTCESALGTAGNAFYSGLWQQAAAQGITVLVATGDNGAAGCDVPNAGVPAVGGFAVSGTASTPYNVAVGGTEFNEGSATATYWSATNSANFSSAIGYIPEAAWNESCDPGQAVSATNCAFGTGNLSLLAGGGGMSSVYAKPSWQTGKGVPADGQRDLPDVTLAAAASHDDIVYCTSLGGVACQVNGQGEVVGLTLVGGTSAATPAMAGILALVEQKNGAFQGQINYALYRLAQSNSCDSSKQTNPNATNTCVFYDVTTGGNAVPCAGASPGCSSTKTGTNGVLTGQAAGPGYDLATGLGSVNAANLANNWTQSTRISSLTTLQMGSANFVHGTAVSLNGTVAAPTGSGTPSGLVGLKTDSYGNMPDTMALCAGAFSGTITDLPGGQYNLSAHYPGDGNFAASDSSTVAMSITPEGSTTTLTVTGLQNGSVGYGSPLSVQVSVAGASGMGVATGTITLLDGANAVGTYALASDGEATIPICGSSGACFGPGSHSLTASYGGDNSFNASGSSAVAFSVGLGTPFVVVGVNTNTPSAGQTLGAHAVVSGSASVPATGTIQFTDNGIPIGVVVPLQAGGLFGTMAQASALLANLSSGQHIIGANYNAGADPNYVSVASGDPKNELTQTITVGAASGTPTTTTLTATTLPVNLGDTGTFSITISPAAATGTVTLWDAVGPRGSSATLAGGAASISIAWPQGGSTSLYAIYSGDATHAASTSAPVAFSVNRGVPGVSLSAPSTSGGTQQVSLNASVTGNPGNTLLVAPTGFIEFWDAVNGAPAQIISVQGLTAGAGNIAVYASRFKFAGGTHVLHVHYRGDTNWQPADSPNVTLTASDFTVAITPSPLTIAGGSAGTATVTLTPLDGATGVVILTCPGGTNVPAGYACSIASSVTVGGAALTTSLNLTLATTSASGITVASQVRQAMPWGLMSFAAGVLLLGMALCGMGGGASGRNFVSVAGLMLCVSSLVLGCGGGSGGGGGGGGPVSTTTTLVSSSPKVAYLSPVQFNVTVTASVTPEGKVQLYDNGQVLGTAGVINGGIGVFTSNSLPVGVHVITAQYLGDTNAKPSSSTPITQVVVGSVPLQITATSASGISHTANVTVVVN